MAYSRIRFEIQNSATMTLVQVESDTIFDPFPRYVSKGVLDVFTTGSRSLLFSTFSKHIYTFLDSAHQPIGFFSRLNEGEGGVLPERKVMTTCFIGVA